MLIDVSNKPSNWDEFMEDAIQERIFFRPEEVYEETTDRGRRGIITRKYYPIHPKNTGNRRYIKERMESHIKHLLMSKIVKKFNLNLDAIDQIGMVEHDDMAFLDENENMVFSEVRYNIQHYYDNTSETFFMLRYYTEDDEENKTYLGDYKTVEDSKAIEYYMNCLIYQNLLK